MSAVPLPPGGIRIASLLPGLFFLRYPSSVIPPEGIAAAIVSDERRAGAIWRDGAWRMHDGRQISWTPTHWFALDGESPA